MAAGPEGGEGLMKANRKELLLTSLVCLLPLLAGVILYPRLPETMATHWGFDGTANGWMPRGMAVFGLPLLILALNFICFYAMSRDPKRANISVALQTVTQWICPAVSLLCGTVTLGTGMGYEMHVGTVAPMFVGLLFLIIGNYLPKTKQSGTMGIRLPWTLASEENWNHTHRVAGFLWVLAGLLMLLAVPLRLHGPTVTVTLLALAAGIPVLYSYLYYRRHEKGGER